MAVSVSFCTFALEQLGQVRPVMTRPMSGGPGVFWLGVWERNAKARAFYARQGFRDVGEHLFPIGKRVDRDLLLAKDLP
jgi:ribosomal protein S18 acetylase RimI-like enzyme